MSESAAIDFANQAFYGAFAAADINAMADVWAARAPVSCTHPGGGPIFGRDSVLASWRSIFSGVKRFPIRHRLVRIDISEGIGIAHSIEILDNATLAATNLFVREGRIWRMIHHHAGSAPLDPGEISEPPAGSVN
jgi:ketosteroid isomerase-like protein